MPYANNDRIRIHYQLEGQGPPLLIHHGFAGSVEDWYERGYVEGLKTDYRLILLDARGHGLSDKPHDPNAYAMKLRVGDAIAALDDLHVSQAHFFGYSMGGWVGFAIAQYAPERFQSLIIGGSDPYPPEPGSSDQRIQMLKQGLDAAMAYMEARLGSLSPERRARVLASDVEALIAHTLAGKDDPGFEALLPAMAMPCLLFAGEAANDYPGAKACSQRMPNATFFSLPGLDHVQAIDRSDLVLPQIKVFLAQVTQSLAEP